MSRRSGAGVHGGIARAGLCLLLCLLTGPAAQAAGPYQLRAPVTASSAAASDLLGYSMAASGRADGTYAAAGALVGRFVLLLRLLEGPARMVVAQKLQSPTTADDFGAALALEDGADRPLVLAVGANVDDTQNFNAGKVYLYRYDGSALVLEQTLYSPNPVLVGNFGTSLALEEDLLAVGEPKAMHAGGNLELGAVHLYRHSAQGWTLEGSVFGTDPGARFGQSVALRGSQLVIGAALEDDTANGLADTGAGYIYTIDGGAWALQARVLAADRQAGDRLGIAAAIDGNVVVFGAGNDDKPAGVEAGSAYVFRRTGVQWSEDAKLRSPLPQLQERFGQSVTARGNEISVGAYCLNVSGCVGSGSVYTFARSGNQWDALARISPDSSGAQNFGHAHALAGRDRLVVGAFGADLAGPLDSGAAYLVTGADHLFFDGSE